MDKYIYYAVIMLFDAQIVQSWKPLKKLFLGAFSMTLVVLNF